MSNTQVRSDARGRILETADRLFYAEGVRSVGVDRIIAEAEVAKMTLYNHFGSKDDLILAMLEYREEKFDRFFRSAVERHTTSGMDSLQALFAALKEWFQSDSFRGCAFINASVELADATHPAAKFATQHKRRFHDWLQQLVVETAGRRAAAVAPAIAVLVEGAIVTAVMEGTADSADVARDAAVTLVSKSKSRPKPSKK
jgi:AcrR family transcriptional regulator